MTQQCWECQLTEQEKIMLARVELRAQQAVLVSLEREAAEARRRIEQAKAILGGGA